MSSMFVSTSSIVGRASDRLADPEPQRVRPAVGIAPARAVADALDVHRRPLERRERRDDRRARRRHHLHRPVAGRGGHRRAGDAPSARASRARAPGARRAASAPCRRPQAAASSTAARCRAAAARRPRRTRRRSRRARRPRGSRSRQATCRGRCASASASRWKTADVALAVSRGQRRALDDARARPAACDAAAASPRARRARASRRCRRAMHTLRAQRPAIDAERTAAPPRALNGDSPASMIAPSSMSPLMPEKQSR